jgi:hypothetical protein
MVTEECKSNWLCRWVEKKQQVLVTLVAVLESPELVEAFSPEFGFDQGLKALISETVKEILALEKMIELSIAATSSKGSDIEEYLASLSPKDLREHMVRVARAKEVNRGNVDASAIPVLVINPNLNKHS